MAPTVSEMGSERAAVVERFGSGGMALLPWTKQMLTVLWEQLRLLVQVIYYTFMSVFQMFRFEVHVRITDETGDIQHMSTASTSSESFLFSSLFDGENGVVVGGSNPLSNFCADVGDPFSGKSTAEALLSSLRADDLCCGLVDDFVSRTGGKEDGLLLGQQSTWKVGFPGDWNIFVSSSDGSSSTDSRQKAKPDLPKEKVFKQETSEEERSSHWSSEEEQSVLEFESEESKALWESLSKSSDPYNPFFFSACISTNSNMGKSDVGDGGDSDLMSVTKACEKMLGPPGLNMWVCRTDSESSWSSWAGSDGSSPDVDKEENDRLWELFSSPEDPYNPLCFTATTALAPTPQTASEQASLPAPSHTSDTDSKESSVAPSDEDEELLWKLLSPKDDPYHPLNFKACLQSSSTTLHEDPKVFDTHHTENPPSETTRQMKPRHTRPALPGRSLKHHRHPDKTLVPWSRPERTPPGEKRGNETATPQKKVQFSPVVQVHVMRTWSFARQACRKGHWEEMARDRDRFRRRIVETEQTVGRCLDPAHRRKVRAYLEQAEAPPGR